jgi:hypothetical protein
MKDYIFLFHDDVPEGGAAGAGADWEPYIARLVETGGYVGGSEIGDGACVNKLRAAPPVTANLVGYLLLQAEDMEEAKKLLAGNPLFEAGGTVEIRELPEAP